MSKQGPNKSSETIFSIVVCVIVLGIATSYASNFWEQWQMNREGLNGLGYQMNKEQTTSLDSKEPMPSVLNAPPIPISDDSFST